MILLLIMNFVSSRFTELCAVEFRISILERDTADSANREFTVVRGKG